MNDPWLTDGGDDRSCALPGLLLLAFLLAFWGGVVYLIWR